MKTIKLIYKLGIILLLSGCLNIACDWSYKEIHIDQESKDYCLYAKGSYWIYQDSASHAIDSNVIEYPVSYTFSRSRENGCKCETFNFGILSFVDDTTLLHDFMLTTSSADPELLKPCLLEAEETKYHNGEIGETFPDIKGDFVLYAKNNNYQINGKTYTNVKIFKYSGPDKDVEKTFYWAKHIGLIREEIYKDSTVSIRNLIKYKVKPYNQ